MKQHSYTVLVISKLYANKVIQTAAEKLPCLAKSFSLTIYLTVEKRQVI